MECPVSQWRGIFFRRVPQSLLCASLLGKINQQIAEKGGNYESKSKKERKPGQDKRIPGYGFSQRGHTERKRPGPPVVPGHGRGESPVRAVCQGDPVPGGRSGLYPVHVALRSRRACRADDAWDTDDAGSI